MPGMHAQAATFLHAQVSTLNVAAQAEGPRWNLFQWLQYWCTRQEQAHAPDGAAAAAAALLRAHSASSLDDEADSRRDAKRRSEGAQHRPSRTCGQRHVDHACCRETGMAE